MKQLTVILSIALIFFAACKKDTAADAQLRHDLAGSWELSKSYVGINVNGGVINYEPGNGNILTFSNNGQFTQTVVNTDTTYTATGTYTLQKEDSCGINLLTKRNNSNESYNYHITVQLNSLTISEGNCIADHPTFVYLRKI